MSEPAATLSAESASPSLAQGDTLDSLDPQVDAYLDSQATPSEPPLDAASRSDTPADAPGPVPYPRFQEVIQERNTAREQLDRFSPYQPLIDTLTESGLSAQEVLAYLSGQAVQPDRAPAPAATPGDPQDAYHQWLASQGVDPLSLDGFTYQLGQRQWQLEQQVQGFQQAQAQAESQALEAQLDSQMRAAQAKHPFLADPEMTRQAYARFAFDAPQGKTFEASIDAFAGSINKLIAAETARYAAGKQADAKVPVASGGAAPAPTARTDFHTASPQEQDAMLDAYLNAARSG